MKKRLNDVLFWCGLALIIFAFMLRICWAWLLGNVWMAFIPDSFIGYPWFHIIGILGFGLMLSFTCMYKREIE